MLDLNELVLGLSELLKRSLGEPITLTTVLAGRLWPTRVDPSDHPRGEARDDSRASRPKAGSIRHDRRRHQRPPALAQADVAVAMNTGTQAAKEAGNMVDLDSNPTPN